jgi:hypothetical protein
MFCSDCGGVVAQGLSYCSHCGAVLSGARINKEHKPAELFPDSLVWAIVSVFVVGLGGTIGLMAVMKDAQAFNSGQILGLSFMSFVTMLAVEAVLIYLLLSRRGGTKEEGGKYKIKATTVRELGVASERSLSEPSLSVTDQTTRSLEPAYRERKG